MANEITIHCRDHHYHTGIEQLSELIPPHPTGT